MAAQFQQLLNSFGDEVEDKVCSQFSYKEFGFAVKSTHDSLPATVIHAFRSGYFFLIKGYSKKNPQLLFRKC